MNRVEKKVETWKVEKEVISLFCESKENGKSDGGGERHVYRAEEEYQLFWE